MSSSDQVSTFWVRVKIIVRIHATLNKLTAALLGLFLFFSSPALACDRRDRAALLKIRATFENASKFSSWDLSASCCTWFGVYCNPFNNGNRVTVLSFYNSDGPHDGLSGRLPGALGDLPFLYNLNLGNHPNLRGTLPASLASLLSLSVLGLSHNSLSGNIPSFLSRLRSLTLLDLSANKFSGCIPPELSALPVLQSLILEDNKLEGNIPASFGNFNKTSPPALFLSHNKLSGSIPTELGEANWSTIDFSHNKLSGDATFLFGANKVAYSINISFNNLQFDISSIKFPVNLWSLDLSKNKVTGSIPAQINQLSGLTHFNVSYNRLCGKIPAGPVMERFDDTHFVSNKCLCRSKDSCMQEG